MRVEMGLYRIAQEGLNNVAQHAQANSVTIELVALPAELRLIIEDDGQGFDPELANKERFGLLGISERARLLGAELHLETDIGAGTRLAVNVPLDNH
jgi:signal transduction histidine kinase